MFNDSAVVMEENSQLEKLLNKIPPDFDLAKKHGDANRIKDF